MERESHINLELTGQAQNAYSNGMAENSGEHMGINPDSSTSSEAGRVHPFRTEHPDASPEDQQRTREALERAMGGSPSDPITRGLLDEIIRIGADVPSINRGEDTSFRAQMNLDEDGQGNGAPPEDDSSPGEGVPPPDSEENSEHGNEEE